MSDNLTEEQEWEEFAKALEALPSNKLLNLHDNIAALPAASYDSWTRFSYPHPIEFAEKVLNIWEYLKPETVAKLRQYGLPWYTEDQKAFFDSVVENKRTLALAGNSVGKTFSMAIIALWLYHRGYMVLTTAPTLEQVQDLLWGQMREFKHKAQPGMGGNWLPQKARCSFSERHFMAGFTVRSDSSDDVSTQFQGRHKDQVALIIDEAMAVPYGVIEAGDRICVTPTDRIVAAANATDKNAAISEASRVEQDGVRMWNVIHISGENHPNVIYNEIIIPGAVTKDYVDGQLAKCGGNRDGAIYRSSVLGQFPDNDEDALIEEAWIRRAQARGAQIRPNDFRGIAIGVDVAGEGGDLCASAGVNRAKVFFPKLSQGQSWLRYRDTQACVDLVHKILQEIPDIRAVGMDATGLGVGPFDQLTRERDRFPSFSLIQRVSTVFQDQKMQKAALLKYNFSKPRANEASKERFATFKAELWWFLREKLRLDEVDLPTDEELRAIGLPKDSSLIVQLETPIYFQDAKGAIVVLDRKGSGGQSDAVRERARNLPTKSPDLAHAVLLAVWVYFNVLKKGEKPITSMEDIDRARLQVIHQKYQQKKKLEESRSRFGSRFRRR